MKTLQGVLLCSFRIRTWYMYQVDSKAGICEDVYIYLFTY